MNDNPKFWIGVVSRDHVMRGSEQGFIMLNHGKEAPLKRMNNGDWLVYYSPKLEIDGAPLKAFTALARIDAAPAYQAEMRPGMLGFRRDAHYERVTEIPIAELRDGLDFTQGNWGMLARRGHFEISERDFMTIRTAMTQLATEDPH